MKIAIVNSVAGISAEALATRLTKDGHQATAYKPNINGKYDYTDHDVVFNYGHGYYIHANKMINSCDAIRKCVSKPASFAAFEKAKVNTVEHVIHRADIPKKWSWVVVRKEAQGRKAEGLDYYENIPGNVPNGELFSEYFEHRYEYRVMVFMGEVIGYYFKRRKPDGMWYFHPQPNKGFELMGEQCIRAAKEIGIDYVGFDVVALDKKNFRILEANSAPAITPEAEETISNYFKKV